MSDAPQQNYANHRRFVPMYHFVTFGILALFFIVTVWNFLSSLGGTITVLGLIYGILSVAAAFAVICTLFFARLFPLGVQDRLIRLEERMRCERLLPDDLKARLDDLQRGQWIALRFAPDEELADLVRDALDNGTAPNDIKQKIKNWRADNWRI